MWTVPKTWCIPSNVYLRREIETISLRLMKFNVFKYHLLIGVIPSLNFSISYPLSWLATRLIHVLQMWCSSILRMLKRKFYRYLVYNISWIIDPQLTDLLIHSWNQSFEWFLKWNDQSASVVKTSSFAPSVILIGGEFKFIELISVGGVIFWFTLCNYRFILRWFFSIVFFRITIYLRL